MLEEIVLSAMDCLEDCFETMGFAYGKRMYEVLLILVGFLGFSLAMKYLGIFTFVSWQEATTAIVIVLIIILGNQVNKSSIRRIKDKLVAPPEIERR